MTSLSSMQIQVDNWINQHPYGYFDAEGLCKKSEEEILETKNAIRKLIGEEKDLDKYKSSHIPEANQMSLKKCREEVALELGDVLFALCCLSNKYKFCLEKPYLSLLRHRSTRMKKIWDKFIYKITGTSTLLPPDGRSRYKSDYPNIATPYAELLRQLQKDAALIRQYVIPNEKLLERPLTEIDDTIQKVRNNVLGCLLIFLDDLIKLSHKGLFDLESCFEAVMEKNNKRAANNYKKEVL